MKLSPIRNEKDHAAALSEIELLWGADEGTQEGDRLEILVTLVEAYERAHFPIHAPDRAEALMASPPRSRQEQ